VTRAADLPLRVVAPATPAVAPHGSVRELTAEVAVLLDPAFDAFAGHFPGAPVLPAMCLVDLALRAASLVAGADLDLVSVERARFSRRILPGEELSIRVTLGAAGGGTRSVAADLLVLGEAAAHLRLRAAESA